MQVVFFVWDVGEDFWLTAAKALMDFHKSAGHDVVVASYRGHVVNTAKDAAVVYFFNGEYPWLWESKQILHGQGKRILYLELGWFQQQDHFYCDWRGTNGESSLHFDDLSWLEEADYAAMEEKRISYREGIPLTNEGYVLVPLQVPRDTNFIWSPLSRNGDVIRMAKKLFAGRDIVFRKHPLDAHHYSDMEIDLERGSSKPVKDMIMAADLVWGMNSTVLAEAALLGKRTIAFARSFLHIGTSQREALAALVARQIPKHAEDLTPWMRPGRGLEHLKELA